MSVTNGDLKEAVDNGATTMEEVQDITGAATCCGACADNVQRMVDYCTTESLPESAGLRKNVPGGDGDDR